MFLYKLYVTVCYTNGCLCSNVTPEDGHDERPKHVVSWNESQDTVASRWIYLYILKYDARNHEPKKGFKVRLYSCVTIAPLTLRFVWTTPVPPPFFISSLYIFYLNIWTENWDQRHLKNYNHLRFKTLLHNRHRTPT
jgi:hypothetical protein